MVWQLFPRTFRGWIYLLLGSGLALGAFCLLLLYTTPHWYRPLDPTDQRVMDAAERAQYVALDLHNKLEQLPLGQRSWSITQDQVNSFLAVRSGALDGATTLRAGHVTAPMVILRPGEILLAARIAGAPGGGSAGGVITVVAAVAALAPDGAGHTPIQVTLRGVKMGSLPVPASLIQEKMPDLAKAISAAISKSVDPALLNSLLAGQAVAVPIKYRKHTVYIKDIQVTDGQLTLVLSAS